MATFATALPRIRRRVRRDLALPGPPRDKVLATVVRLLETTRMRVGNEEYARENESFGACAIYRATSSSNTSTSVAKSVRSTQPTSMHT
jgi:DNA topoisomerase IB